MTVALLANGVSETALFVDQTTMEGRRYLQGLNAFGIESTIREDLARVWEECREPNWDGFEALAVNYDTLLNAKLFIESLPLGFPTPSIGAEPDGDLTLEWHDSPRRTLSVSVTSDGYLHYAALFGPNRVYGTEAFFDDIPGNILNLIRRV